MRFVGAREIQQGDGGKLAPLCFVFLASCIYLVLVFVIVYVLLETTLKRG